VDLDLSTVIGAVADALPERECFVHGSTRLTYAEFVARANQLAHVLHDHGLGCRHERGGLAGHESGQDHLALYLHNSAEFLEANVGAFTARVAPFNVNYRYVAAELVALLIEQRARAVVFHSTFAPTVDAIRADLPDVVVWLQVADRSGHELVPGAQWWHEALDARPPTPPPVAPSPDDLYILCTGGTTGSPKGVLWRQADIFVAALGGVSTRTRQPFASLAEAVGDAVERGGRRNMPTAPFMHGAAQWTALTALTHGHTVVVPTDVTRLDPADVWATVEREGVTLLQLVGDTFARPLLDELDSRPYDLSTLKVVANGGAILSARAKARFLAARPGLLVADGLGSSEAGPVANRVDDARGRPGAGGAGPTGVFSLGPGGRILAPDLDRVLPPGDPTVGWLATTGRIPLGYLGDPDRTARTFPVVDGVRFAVPGDRARHRGDGTVELLGRDSVTINTGGEKVYAEEVEQALLRHPAVHDAVVCGRPSDRWGHEVVAVVALRPEATATPDELRAFAGEHLARYKLPRAIVFRDAVQRSPAGKADYAWARAQAGG
jgi:acyl-CoA synthetase (AMP-forming)/AMP-acid ligase II